MIDTDTWQVLPTVFEVVLVVCSVVAKIATWVGHPHGLPGSSRHHYPPHICSSTAGFCSPGWCSHPVHCCSLTVAHAAAPGTSVKGADDMVDSSRCCSGLWDRWCCYFNEVSMSRM